MIKEGFNPDSILLNPNWLSHLDPQFRNGGEVTVKIDRGCTADELGDRKEQKPALLFKGCKKGLVLNKTNLLAIIKRHGMPGEKAANWHGKEITIYGTTCKAFGNPKQGCLRVK